jgi:hypothetical protein
VAFGAVADEAVGTKAGKIHADRDAFAHVGVIVVDQALARMQRAQRFGIEQRIAAAEADLRQARALAYQHRKRARADLGIKRTVIAHRDMVEAARLVGDHAGENVEPAGRTLGVGGGRNILGQRQAFDQRHDVDATGLEHGAVAQRDIVQLQLVDALGDGGIWTRQKTGAHAIGHFAQPQIEARGLDLVGDEVVAAQDGTIACERRDHVVGQDAFLVNCKGERHDAKSPMTPEYCPPISTQTASGDQGFSR